MKRTTKGAERPQLSPETADSWRRQHVRRGACAAAAALNLGSNFCSTFHHTAQAAGLHNRFTVHFCRQHFTRGLSISVTDTTDRLFNLAKTSTSTANAKSSFSLFQPCVLAPLLLGCSAGPRLITRTFDGLKTNVSAVISQRQGKRASFFSLTWECLPRHLAAAWHSL